LKHEDLRIEEAPPLVREQALRKLRSAIINGLYRPGTRLKERELCDALGVSRTSVREVLRQLETEGLVNVGSRHTRPIVAEITERDAYEIYELREVIEVFVVRSFIRKMTKRDVQKLRSVYVEIAKSVRLEDIPKIADAVARFYDIFYVGAGNLTIHAVIRRLMARISYLRTRSLSEPGRLAAGLDEVQAILQAIEAGDLDAAEAAVRIHMRNSMAAALSGLRSLDGRAV
jgi:DNA-binding GntR family transcriptional regulator